MNPPHHASMTDAEAEAVLLVLEPQLEWDQSSTPNAPDGHVVAMVSFDGDTPLPGAGAYHIVPKEGQFFRFYAAHWLSVKTRISEHSPRSSRCQSRL